VRHYTDPHDDEQGDEVIRQLEVMLPVILSGIGRAIPDIHFGRYRRSRRLAPISFIYQVTAPKPGTAFAIDSSHAPFSREALDAAISAGIYRGTQRLPDAEDDVVVTIAMNLPRSAAPDGGSYLAEAASTPHSERRVRLI
jgi:hypothetical protein